MDVGKYIFFVQVDIVHVLDCNLHIYHLSVIYFNTSIIINSLHTKPRLGWTGLAWRKLGDHHHPAAES